MSNAATAEQKNDLLTGLVRTPCPLCGSGNTTPERVVAGYGLEKCRECSMVFMNPRCTSAHLDEIYTVRDEASMIDLYSKIASTSVLGEYDDKLEKLEKLAPQKGRLLDYACAAGYFYEKAQHRGWDAYGYDIGLWAAKAANKRGLSNMFVGPSLDGQFPDNHFDVVYAAQAFEHLLNPGETLDALLRLLKPGGIMFIDVPNYNTLPIRFNKDDFMLNEPPQHINYFAPSTLEKLISDAGLENIKLYSEGGLKWENLIGRSIESDIAAAYGLVDDSAEPPKESIMSRLKTTAKEAAKTIVVDPFLYRGMKVGMNLGAISHKPET
jgi:2-polyprenyl-3-methyl-5-hydroxy-6-metoxy-1,4-benzoquinol methylase